MREKKIVYSESEKKANDYDLAKYEIDNYADNLIDPELIKKDFENLNLHAGRWPAVEEISNERLIKTPEGDFTVGNIPIRHYDEIGHISRGIHSQMIMAPLDYNIKDMSSKARNVRDAAMVSHLKEYLNQKYIEPERKRITQEYMISNQITDVTQLSPDQQDQMITDIDERVKKSTPSEVFNAISKTKVPDEIVCSRLFEYTINEEKIKDKFDQGGEFAICNGREYYRPWISNNYPVLDVLVPSGVNYGLSTNKEMVEDGMWATYKQSLPIMEVIQRHGLGFMANDISNLQKYFNADYIPGSTGYSMHNKEIRMTEIIGKDNNLNKINYLTRDGQQMLYAISAAIGTNYNLFRVEEVYVTWRWTKKAKVVTRIYNGRPKEYIVDGNYRFNPKFDLSIRNIVIPHVWEGIRLGNSDWYSGVGPRDYQYSSIDRVFNPHLGIFGGQYNTIMGTVPNYSLIDNGKIWNYRIDVLMARNDHEEATDIGKVAFMYAEDKPDGILLGDWLSGLINNKIALKTRRSELEYQNGSTIDMVDMSKLSDSAGFIQKLQYAEQKLMQKMYFNPAKIGAISQYSTNQNVGLQIDAADRQLLSFYKRHEVIMQNVCREMMKLSLISYKDNETVKNSCLNEYLKAHYEENMQNEDIGNYRFDLVDTRKEKERQERITSLALGFVQNGLITLKELDALLSASTSDEIQEVIDISDNRRREEGAIENENKRKIEEMNFKLKQELLRMKQEFDASQNDKDREIKLTISEINSRLMANANDINGDKVNDSVQRTEKENESKERINDAKLAVERLKIFSKK